MPDLKSKNAKQESIELGNFVDEEVVKDTCTKKLRKLRRNILRKPVFRPIETLKSHGIEKLYTTDFVKEINKVKVSHNSQEMKRFALKLRADGLDISVSEIFSHIETLPTRKSSYKRFSQMNKILIKPKLPTASFEEKKEENLSVNWWHIMKSQSRKHYKYGKSSTKIDLASVYYRTDVQLIEDRKLALARVLCT